MANLNGYDANQHEPSKPRQPLPSGRYLAAITESTMQPTKDRAGEFLALDFTVLDGEHKGRHVWARLNLKNKSAQAVKIAEGDLSAICHAVGILKPHDSCELHNIPLCLTVKCKPRKGAEGEFDNDIVEYATEASYREWLKKAPAGGQADAPAAGGGDTPPWAR